MKAIILAGGKGTRLAPYTTVLPKPLLPIGDMPIIDVVIRQLAFHGFDDITLAVGYLAELIMAYCHNGDRYGLKLNYSREETPLGTAGPISLVSNLNDTFLVMNGDLLTNIDYRSMWAYHKKRGSVATLAVYRREVKIDFGITESDDEQWLTDYIEKPVYRYAVSTGIYIFEPSILRYIPFGHPLDLPDLVKRLLSQGEKVCTYPFSGYWLDIGRHEDYETALRDFESLRHQILPPS